MNNVALVCFAVLGIVGCTSKDEPEIDSGGGPRDAASDANPWSGCRGSQGMPLSCASYGARIVTGSRYDPERQCFTPSEQIDEVCAVPTHCPGGGGEVACLVSPSGYVFAAVMLYGEELSDPAWHFGSGLGFENTLTDADEILCEKLRQAWQIAASDEDAGTVDVGFISGSAAKVSPACATSGE